MKKMKRLVALALSVVMVLAMSVVAFAATGDDASEGETAGTTTTKSTYTITAPATNHQYEIYQIFTGDLNPDGKTFSSLKWGKNGTGIEGEVVSEEVINALTAVNSASDENKLNVIKDYVDLKGTPAATITNGGHYTAEAGYYLIKDKDNTVTGEDSYTKYIVQVSQNMTIAPKSDVPDFVKKIKDTNDTTGKTSDWQDSADYDIGDDVPFKLEGTVASNYADYKQYYFAFHDKEEAGKLEFNANTVKVYVDDVELDNTKYTVSTSPTDGCTFEVIFNNLKAIPSVKAGSKIRVEYTSKLLEGANIGNRGNMNQAKLEFSNNPNDEQGGEKGETPWDNVIVFTYKVVVNKVDSASKALAGAEFTLSKKIKNADGTETTKDITVIKSNAGTTFTFEGLDDGDYILTETKTPDGYNTISPITFTVTATHDIEWTSVDTRNQVLTSLNGNAASGEITFTSNTTEGSLSTNVVNNKGSQLPSTGGIGTTIFYVVGGILMVGAAVLLITKRRAEN